MRLDSVATRTDEPKEHGHARLLRTATYASVVVAIGLVLAKMVTVYLTNSVAMLGSLMDSLLDIAASVVNMLAVRASLTPADKEHRFGHGKAESIAGLFQSAVVMGSAAFLIWESGNRIFETHPVENGVLGIGVSVASLVVTGVLVLFQKHVVRVTGSNVIAADQLHYTSDLLMNIAVVVALLLSTTAGIRQADAWFGLAIAVYISVGAWGIGYRAFEELMDRELPEAERRKIRSLVCAQPGVLDMHDLRTRGAGLNSFVQFHIDLDPAISLWEAHDICDAVELKLKEVYPLSEILIHADPKGVDEQRAIFH